MHYKNGREAKVGDTLVGRDAMGRAVAGVLVEIEAGTTTCNGQVVPATTPTHCVTLGFCLHIEDALPEED